MMVGDEIPSRERLVDHIGDLQRELLARDGLKSEVEWLEHSLKQRTRLLNERVKELSCIISILKILRESGLTFHRRMQGVIDVLPSGWQYPEDACARMETLHGVFETAPGRETPWNLKRDVFVNKKKHGIIEVGYESEKPLADEGPFLREEQQLLEIVCECVGLYLERSEGLPLPSDQKQSASSRDKGGRSCQ